jgi:hypothetical protein
MQDFLRTEINKKMLGCRQTLYYSQVIQQVSQAKCLLSGVKMDNQSQGEDRREVKRGRPPLEGFTNEA